jgi:Xaa-Pro aminopeptidase
VKEGDMMLLDMGAEYYCYGADITRCFPINGKFTEKQRQIYETVLAAQQAVMDSMKPGVPWIDMHTLAYRVNTSFLSFSSLFHGFFLVADLLIWK